MQIKKQFPSKPQVIHNYPSYIVFPTREIQNTETGTFIKASGKTNKKVNLQDAKGKRRMVLISRIMATAFIPNPKNLPCVLHCNGNSTDDALSNLKWGTQRDVLINALRVKNKYQG